MGITAAALHTAIMAKITEYNNGAYQNEKDAPRHVEIETKAIKDYLEANLKVTFAWVAVNPSGTPDPTTSFDATVSFATFAVVKPETQAGKASQLQAGVMTAILTAPAGFTLPPGSFLLTSPLTLGSTDTPTNAILNTTCTPLVSWLKTLINPAPLVGAHGIYMGSAVMSSIS